MTDLYPGSGARLEALRRLSKNPDSGRRYTQGELADRAEVSRATYSVAVNNDRMTARTARKLAATLGVSHESILFGESPSGQWEPEPDPPETPQSEAGRQLEDVFSNLDRIVRMLSNSDQPLSSEAKISILNHIEDAAREAGQVLPPEYWQIRARIHNEAVDATRRQ